MKNRIITTTVAIVFATSIISTAMAQIPVVGGPQNIAGLVQKAVEASKIYSAPELIQHWGKALNKPIIWEAGDQYAGRKIGVDQRGDISTLEGFQSALNWLNSLLDRANVVPLIACVNEDAIAVRRIDQPQCGKPL